MEGEIPSHLPPTFETVDGETRVNFPSLIARGAHSAANSSSTGQPSMSQIRSLYLSRFVAWVRNPCTHCFGTCRNNSSRSSSSQSSWRNYITSRRLRVWNYLSSRPHTPGQRCTWVHLPCLGSSQSQQLTLLGQDTIPVADDSTRAINDDTAPAATTQTIAGESAQAADRVAATLDTPTSIDHAFDDLGTNNVAVEDHTDANDDIDHDELGHNTDNNDGDHDEVGGNINNNVAHEDRTNDGDHDEVALSSQIAQATRTIIHNITAIPRVIAEAMTSNEIIIRAQAPDGTFIVMATQPAPPSIASKPTKRVSWSCNNFACFNSPNGFFSMLYRPREDNTCLGIESHIASIQSPCHLLSATKLHKPFALV